jgi:hypothetical protein
MGRFVRRTGIVVAVSPDGGKVLLARQAPTLIDLMIAR